MRMKKRQKTRTRTRTQTYLLQLPCDCLQTTLSFYSCSTILSLRLTCKDLYKLLILSNPKNWMIRERKINIEENAQKESSRLREAWNITKELKDRRASVPWNYHKQDNHSNALLRSQLKLMLTIIPNNKCLRCTLFKKMVEDSSDPEYSSHINEKINRCKSCDLFYECKYCDDNDKKWRFCESCQERFCLKCSVHASCRHDLCTICAYDEGKLFSCENPKCTSKISNCSMCLNNYVIGIIRFKCSCSPNEHQYICNNCYCVCKKCNSKCCYKCTKNENGTIICKKCGH